MFEFEGITKTFAGIEAVVDLSLSVAQGRTTVLIGPSGCGKSTLLRLALGLTAPDTGTIMFGGERLIADNAEPMRRRMGYVIQGGGLFPHMTARANASVMARHLGWRGARVEARLADLLELTHLPADVLDRYPVELSGGQRQRVALMRGLMLSIGGPVHDGLIDEQIGNAPHCAQFKVKRF